MVPPPSSKTRGPSPWGRLNLHEKSKEIYEISKLKRFLTTVKYMMEVRAAPGLMRGNLLFEFLLLPSLSTAEGGVFWGMLFTRQGPVPL